jgi:hypothetical protein
MNEMKKVILHIGLPKTATTLLQQHVFTKLHQHIDYVGVKQPRSQNQEALYSSIWNLVCAEKSEYSQNIDLVKAKVQSRLNDNNKPFVLSEECFCVDFGNSSWQVKLNRLADIFQGNNVQVLVTIRNPISAIFSYYVELYPTIKSEYSDLIDFSNESNSARIYNYEYLDSVIISAFGNAKVHYVSFESLKSKTFLPDILDFLGIEDRFQFELPNTNYKQKSTIDVKTHNRNILSYLVFIWKVPVLSHFLKLPIVKSVLKVPRNVLSNLNMPMSQTKILKPTQNDIVKLNKQYAESISFINTKTNSGYEKFKK